MEGVGKLASVCVGSEEQVEGGSGEGEVSVHLGEVGEERRGCGAGTGGEERGDEGARGGQAAGVGEDVEELGMSEEGRAIRSKAEEVKGGVRVETDAAEGGVEEGMCERGGGEEAGDGGEAVEEEEASETAQ